MSAMRQQHCPSSNQVSSMNDLNHVTNENINTNINISTNISPCEQHELKLIDDEVHDLDCSSVSLDVTGVVMDELVSTLSHSLCLSLSPHSSTLKSKSCHSQCRLNHRMSPYMVHNNSALNRYGNSINVINTTDYQPSCYCLNCKYFNSANNVNTNSNINSRAKYHHQHKQPHDSSLSNSNSNSPYQMMQELLKEGALIKEAVKRLQLRDDKMSGEEMCGFDYGSEVVEDGLMVNENDQLEMNLINA